MIVTTSALFLASALAAPPPDLRLMDDSRPAETKTVEMSLSPKAADREIFRIRLLPRASDRTPGDAVPIYLRLGAERSDALYPAIDEKTKAYLDGPIAAMPVAEARKFVDSLASSLKQMEYAARRRTAEWNYTLDEQREDAFSILLPDAQALRRWARLLATKARVEIAEKKYDDAARTIETGLSMARQLAQGPFLINGLVGLATANLFLDRIEELIAQPDAPNLYWALTALPRPLVDLRDEMETEQMLGQYLMPNLVEPHGPRTEAPLFDTVARFHVRWVELAKLSAHEGGKDSPKIEPNLAKFRAAILPEAVASLKERDVKLDGMSDDRMILLYLAIEYREARDLVFRGYYLPYHEAVAIHKNVYDQGPKKRAATGTKSNLLQLILPTIDKAHLSEVRVDRRIAALRVIEALRMQAAADNRALPASLDVIKLVPVPNDPITGKPFAFRSEGDARVLTGPSSSDNPIGLSYKITARK